MTCTCAPNTRITTRPGHDAQVGVSWQELQTDPLGSWNQPKANQIGALSAPNAIDPCQRVLSILTIPHRAILAPAQTRDARRCATSRAPFQQGTPPRSARRNRAGSRASRRDGLAGWPCMLCRSPRASPWPAAFHNLTTSSTRRAPCPCRPACCRPTERRMRSWMFLLPVFDLRMAFILGAGEGCSWGQKTEL